MLLYRMEISVPGIKKIIFSCQRRGHIQAPPFFILNMSDLKELIQHALESNDLAEIASLAKKHKRVLSILVQSAYDKESLAAWRAIRAVGHVARELVEKDYEFLRETVRKLLWSLSNESGGIGWSAPEMLGEIVSADPVKFSDIIPLIANAYDSEDVFKPGVLYALSRIAEASPEQVIPHQKLFLKALSDRNPLIKIYGLEGIINMRKHLNFERTLSKIEALTLDKDEVWVYGRDNFIPIEVGDMAQDVINKLIKSMS